MVQSSNPTVQRMSNYDDHNCFSGRAIFFHILSSLIAMLARPLTGADGTQRQSSLLKLDSNCPIAAKILSAVRSYGRYFSRQISE